MRAVLTATGFMCMLIVGCGGEGGGASAGVDAIGGPGVGSGGDNGGGVGGAAGAGTGGNGVGGAPVVAGAGGAPVTGAGGAPVTIGTGGTPTAGTGGLPVAGAGGTAVAGAGGVATGGGAGSGTGGAAAGSSAATIVPLYTVPSDPSWAALIAAKTAHPKVRVIAVVDPASGPGTASDAGYTAGIGKLQLAGITVLGYVPTGYGARSAATIQADIDRWKAFYPSVQGIFFDEQSKSVAYEGLYRTVVQYARSRGLSFTVGNPGNDTAPGYVGVFDVGVIYEGSGQPSTGTLAGWHTTYPPSSFCVLAYGVGALNHAAVKQARTYVGYIYVNSDVLPNPWDSVPGYLSDLLADLE